MRVTLVFPPSLCLPNPIYHSLPLLAGALKRAGHPVSLVDLNVLAADRLLTPEWGERALAEARAAVEREGRERGPGSPSPLMDLVEERTPKILAGPTSKAVLRDPVRNFDPEAFRSAFQTVVEALDFFYILDPVISPHRTAFGRDVMAHQQKDPWSPLRDLYEEVLVDAVLRTRPELVGISVAFPEQAAESVRLAAKLRSRAKEVHICFGGPLISLYSGKWLEDGWLLRFADSVVMGEGEGAVVELVEALEGGKSLEGVRNLVHRDGRGEVRMNHPEPLCEIMDELPLPDFGPADLSLYFTPRPIYPLMISRGCYWGKCAFCSEGWRRNYRRASKEKIRSEAAALAGRRDARYIMVQDSSVPPAGALDLARVIREEGLPLYWMGTMRLEKAYLRPDYCRELYEGGCRSLLLGFESANQRVLDLMGKGVNLDEVPAMLHNLREAGISAELLWFLGFPTETRAEVLRTARYLMDHRGQYGLAAFVGDYQLHPDTRIFERPGEYGLTITGEANDRCTYIAASGMQMEEKDFLKRLFAPTGNRNLVCNGAHLPHLVERGLDLRDIERPMTIPEEAIAYCGE